MFVFTRDLVLIEGPRISLTWEYVQNVVMIQWVRIFPRTNTENNVSI